eukprot:m.77893 g.77893  ORF g.77893 m.77893 type:complete len:473 (+) comp20708_c0_seq2:36-1454(+)
MIPVLIFLLTTAAAAPAADELKAMPGFDGPLPSKQYAGFANATVNGTEYHTFYMFVESQNDPSSDPLVLWQQGGPASSSIGYGYLTELGPFHLSEDSLNTTGTPKPYRNPYSWDTMANVVYFEHPPGTGYSYCGNSGRDRCVWDDQTQAKVFFQTLVAWLKMFPEYQTRDLYITGESYAGILIPLLVEQVMLHADDEPVNLKAFAVGNGCISTKGASVFNRGVCNGPNSEQHTIDYLFGHGMISKNLYSKISSTCDLSKPSAACQVLLAEASRAAGPYLIYDTLDECGDDQVAATEKDKSTLWYQFNAQKFGGNYAAPCGMDKAVATYLNRPEVREAFHVPQEGFYGHPWTGNSLEYMQYTTYTDTPLRVYPNAIKKYRTIIYNGQLDLCVPYNGNEEWTSDLAKEQGLEESAPWHPWFTSNDVVAGYATSYKVDTHNFSFITIKAAGHMVPQYQPVQSLEMIRRILNNEEF